MDFFDVLDAGLDVADEVKSARKVGRQVQNALGPQEPRQSHGPSGAQGGLPHKAPPLLGGYHPLHSLMSTHLGAPAPDGVVLVYPHLDPSTVGSALAALGVGLDHERGEQALVFRSEHPEPPGRYESFALLTDRRLLGRTVTGFGKLNTLIVRYRDMLGARFEKGMLSSTLHLSQRGDPSQLTGGANEEVALSYPEAHLTPIQSFLGAVFQLPPEQREPPPMPLSAVSEEDPSGAGAALALLAGQDARQQLLLTYCKAACERGVMPASVAADLVSRISLFHRNEHYGRGMTEGRWISPLGAADLFDVFTGLFGPPLGHRDEGGVPLWELSSKMKADFGDTRQLARDLGNAMLDDSGLDVLLGIGSWAMSIEPSIERFQLLAADTGSFSSFRLRTAEKAPRGLHEEVPAFLEGTLRRLLELEDAILLRRAVYGWNERGVDLLRRPAQDIVTRLSDVVGPFDPQLLARNTPPTGLAF